MDENEKKLLKLELTEAIHNSVEKKLFRVYILLGAVTATLVSFFGLNLINEAKTLAVENVEESLRKDLTPVQADLEAARMQIQRQIGNLDFLSNELAATAVNAKESLVEIESVSAELKEFQKTADETRSNFEELVIVVAELNRTINQFEGTQQILADVRDETKVSPGNPEDFTIFFQFAGGRREQVKAINDLLKAEGYFVPGEERTESAIDRKEIRYSYPQDEAGAKLLRTTLNNIMSDKGYKIEFPEPVLITEQRYRQAKPGILEIWLEIPYRDID